MKSRIVFLSSICFLFASLFSFSACSFSEITPADEMNASVATTSWLEQHYGIVNYRPASRLLDRIVSRLGQGARASMLHSAQGVLPEYRFANAPWQVFILNVSDPNAFSAGAGTIFVTKGLISTLPSEAALASVISHEMAHQMLGHTAMALEEARGSRDTPMFSYSLEREIAADSLSIQILTAARYNPRKALDALSIAYRPVGRDVSGEEKNWLTLRAANLYQKITLTTSSKPSTITSREFNKIRRQLARL